MAVPDTTVGPRELIENDTNKTGEDTNTSDSKPRTLLTVDINDTDLVKLTEEWSRIWKIYWNKEEKITKEAEDY